MIPPDLSMVNSIKARIKSTSIYLDSWMLFSLLRRNPWMKCFNIYIVHDNLLMENRILFHFELKEIEDFVFRKDMDYYDSKKQLKDSMYSRSSMASTTHSCSLAGENPTTPLLTY